MTRAVVAIVAMLVLVPVAASARALVAPGATSPGLSSPSDPAPRFGRLGVGMRGGVAAIDEAAWGAVGVHLRLRLTRRVAVDLTVERMSRDHYASERWDIPVTLGGLFYFLQGPVSPYVAADVGASFAHSRSAGGADEAAHLTGRVGGGIELRVSPSLTLGADARYAARERVDAPPAAATGAVTPTDSEYVIGDDRGAEFRLIGTLYF